MKIFTTFLIGSALFLGQQSVAFAASLEVKWTEPENYADIDAGDRHRMNFKEKTFKSFEKYFNKLANQLPASQKLILDITNVDLAGDVRSTGTDRARLVKEIYFPRMEFSYQLRDANNNLVKSEDVSLKDMRFLTNSRFSNDRNHFLSYEKNMLGDWFKDAFAE